MDKDFEEMKNRLEGSKEGKEALKGLATMVMKMMAETGDDRAVLMLKFDELQEAIGGLVSTSHEIVRKVEGKLTPLISLIDQAIECAKDILKEVE